MAVTMRGEILGARRAENNVGVRSYVRAFRLFASSKADGPYAVGSHPDVPLIGELHPEDSGAWCQNLSVENDAPFRGWKVTATYSSATELGTDPTTDPAIFDWDSEQFQKVAWISYSGTAIVNSAGDFFDPPNMMDDTRRSVIVTKNLATVPSWILAYEDSVNNDAFTVDGISVGIGVAKIGRVQVKREETRNGVPFRPTEFHIHFRKEGWHLRPLDAGFRQKYTNPLDRVLIKGADFLVTPTPVCLDGSGYALANPNPSNAVFLDFTIYETKPFSALPLT